MQNQTISIIYQDESFSVDYSKLFDSSNKFREMIQPYLDNGVEPQNLQLQILYDKFTSRNVSNFLKMIQNKKNDVHSQEIAEICKLAKLFQAEKLYDKSITYVLSRIDPNFTVPDELNESNGGNYLKLEYANDTNTQNSYNTDYITPNDTNPSINETPTNNYPNTEEKSPSTPQEQHNCFYRIQIFNPAMKCSRYFFSKDGRIIYTAKKKSNEIYIGQGNNIHISSADSESYGRIMQCDGHNIAYTSDLEFRIVYVPYFVRNQYSLTVTFMKDGQTVTWSPSVVDSALNGEFNRVPIQSKKNMILKDQNGSPIFIVRKMEKDIFEVECRLTVNPLIAFIIGLSQIVGPFT